MPRSDRTYSHAGSLPQKRVVAKAKRLASLKITHGDETRTDYTKALTEKQRNFARFWAQGETPYSAAIKAGYTVGSADQMSVKLRRHPQVRALWEAERAKYEAAAQMTRKRVMDGLLEAVEMARLMSEPSTMVAGWREIGRMCGYYEPVRAQLDVNVTGNLAVQRMNQLSDAELLKLITSHIDGDEENHAPPSPPRIGP